MATSTKTLLVTRRFKVVEHVVTRPDGTVASCPAVEHPGAVAVLPILPGDLVCLIRSRRLTVGRTLIEVPAGTREVGEEPLETAHRELREETGYTAERMELMASFYTSPGILSEKMHVFRATGLTEGPPAREANEEIENLVVPIRDALAMVERGEIEDGKTIVALLAHERGSRTPH